MTKIKNMNFSTLNINQKHYASAVPKLQNKTRGNLTDEYFYEQKFPDPWYICS